MGLMSLPVAFGGEGEWIYVGSIDATQLAVAGYLRTLGEWAIRTCSWRSSSPRFSSSSSSSSRIPSRTTSSTEARSPSWCSACSPPAWRGVTTSTPSALKGRGEREEGKESEAEGGRGHVISANIRRRLERLQRRPLAVLASLRLLDRVVPRSMRTTSSSYAAEPVPSRAKIFAASCARVGLQQARRRQARRRRLRTFLPRVVVLVPVVPLSPSPGADFSSPSWTARSLARSTRLPAR